MDFIALHFAGSTMTQAPRPNELDAVPNSPLKSLQHLRSEVGRAAASLRTRGPLRRSCSEEWRRPSAPGRRKVGAVSFNACDATSVSRSQPTRWLYDSQSAALNVANSSAPRRSGLASVGRQAADRLAGSRWPPACVSWSCGRSPLRQRCLQHALLRPTSREAERP
jgi:hypothetical protein